MVTVQGVDLSLFLVFDFNLNTSRIFQVLMFVCFHVGYMEAKIRCLRNLYVNLNVYGSFSLEIMVVIGYSNP